VWHRYRLKHLARAPISSGVGEAGQQQGVGSIRYLRTTDIEDIWTLHERNMAFLPREVGLSALVQPGDLLMCSAGATVGKSVLVSSVDEEMCYAGFLVRFQADQSKIDPRFVAYWTQSLDFAGQIRAGAIVTTIPNFSASRYSNLSLVAPNLRHQTSIIAFLDSVCNRIDRQLAALAHQRALLEEHRQALITKLIEPADCTATRLKFIARSPITSGVGEAGQQWQPGHIRYIRTTDIESLWAFSDANIAYLPPEAGAKAMLEPGDLLMCSAGATVGKSIYVTHLPQPMCHAGFLVRFRADLAKCEPKFIAYWTQSRQFQGQIEAGAIVTTIPNFSASRYQNLRIGLPSLDKQREIVAKLDEESGIVDTALAELDRSAELLNERKTAIITAAVTGQMEVA
jgi:type I restriction enzyme S subunit